MSVALKWCGCAVPPYLAMEGRGKGNGGEGKLAGELGPEGGQDTAVGRAAAEGGEPPQEHRARLDGETLGTLQRDNLHPGPSANAKKAPQDKSIFVSLYKKRVFLL